MFNSMKEVHAAIRTMSNEELKQVLMLADMMLEQESITIDQWIEIGGVVVAHQLERSIKAQVVEV
jgi:hypothetical protein